MRAQAASSDSTGNVRIVVDDLHRPSAKANDAAAPATRAASGGGKKEQNEKEEERIAAATLERVLYPAQKAAYADTACCGRCRIREENLLSLEIALHSGFSVLIPTVLFVTLSEEASDILAPQPFLLLLFSISGAAGDVGGAVVNALVVLWALLLSVILISVVTLPLYCAPIAQTVVGFPVLWLTRYWLSFVPPTTAKFTPAVYMIVMLPVVDEVMKSVLAGEACEYGVWAPRLLTVSMLFFAMVASFVSTFLPYVPHDASLFSFMHRCR
jgi:hypothetical protein